MPKRVSQGVRHTVQTLSQSGMSQRRIMQTIGVSRNTVKRWMKRDTVKDKVRNSIVNTQQQKGVMKRVLKRTKSLRETGKRLGISPSTVYKYTRRSSDNRNGVFPYKQRPRLRFTDNQLTQRREYCEGLPRSDRGILTHVKKLIFYDEKPMYLEKGVNRQNNRIWNETPITDLSLFNFKDKHPTVIHFFTCISYYEKGTLRWYGDWVEIQRGRGRGM